MTEVLHIPSSPSAKDSLFCSQTQSYKPKPNPNPSSNCNSPCLEEEGSDSGSLRRREKEKERLSVLDLLVEVFRKSLVACKAERKELCTMEIGWPTNVRHVAHVTFDNFDGFLGLPVEFEPEVPRRAPSASTSIFGVSTDSMQLSYDTRGNCVPTILLLMQRRLYAQGGLQAEGIFRINAENSREEFVRDQLNRGIIPDDIEVHCLAGLIKAWFRELPTGVLDPLSPEQVMRCETEEECTELVRRLPPIESALLDWAINLMADVVQEEQCNKMNEHNIAMVFAPNMTQMADPLTALMYAVQVMNFLKTLIKRTLREREDSTIESRSDSSRDPSDESGPQSPSEPCLEDYLADETEETKQCFSDDEPTFNDESPHDSRECGGDESDDSPFQWEAFKEAHRSLKYPFRSGFELYNDDDDDDNNDDEGGQSSNLEPKLEPININVLQHVGPAEKAKSASNLSRISLEMERTEAWR